MAKLRAHGSEKFRMRREEPRPDVTIITTYAFMADGAILVKTQWKRTDSSHDTGWKIVKHKNPEQWAQALESIGYSRQEAA